jgi:hypothetical protein
MSDHRQSFAGALRKAASVGRRADERRSDERTRFSVAKSDDADGVERRARAARPEKFPTLAT